MRAKSECRKSNAEGKSKIKLQKPPIVLCGFGGELRRRSNSVLWLLSTIPQSVRAESVPPSPPYAASALSHETHACRGFSIHELFSRSCVVGFTKVCTD